MEGKIVTLGFGKSKINFYCVWNVGGISKFLFVGGVSIIVFGNRISLTLWTDLYKF